uniref:Cadherin-related family member 2 n=1 Tax=Equus asinus asinus TaxID=83772 RepID=A0A8C4LUW7_EQUAS
QVWGNWGKDHSGLKGEGWCWNFRAGGDRPSAGGGGQTGVPPDVMARPWLSCLLLPALVVTVAANVAPMFLSNMTTVNLPEDLPVGAEAFWLMAEDLDQDPLTYGISGPNAYFFTVTSATGEVKLASPLDYEVQKEMYVIVEDRNDNAPVFQNTGFSTSINETLPVGSLVFSVLAVDKDTGSAGAVVYSIEQVIPSTGDSKHLFEILPNGSIILNGSLSYNNKSAFYQLELKACDSGGLYNNSFVIQCSLPVFLSVSVVDQPDLDPQFVREFYSASVAEDAPQGTSVLQVEAVDGDKGINDLMTYSISNSTRPGWFDIGPDGVIRVSGSLDREQLLEEDEEVQLQVTATEVHPNIYGQEAKVSMWVTLRVTDVNDHKPEFYNCSLAVCTPQDNFTGSVDEHASTRIPIDDLTMVVSDPDKGNNGTFLLSLGGPDAEAFSVSPQRAVGSADVQVLVRVPSLVDYERQPVMLVQVTATDLVSGNSSVASVTIHLRDINDHRPTFPHSLYNLSVFEHSANGFVVTDSIHAFDPDTGEGGRLTYSLLSGNGADVFEVDPDSGTVTVSDSNLLDREKQAMYYLTLQATDGGNLSGSTTLHIFLLDINDNSPVVSGSYNIFVQEEGNVSVTIQAHDDDQPDTNNSRLLFSLLPSPYSHNFSVDPDSGILRNLGPLDREAIDPALGGRIVLTVRVADCGVPVLSTEVNVTITVEDINDNLPIFNKSNYTFQVKERDPGESSLVLVGVVEARDADQTEANNRISFSLSGSGANNFMLRGSVLGSGWAEGRLRLPSDVSLDYETQNSFTLTVNAENPDPQGAEATAQVVVEVEDVNDEPPTLDSASLHGIRVAENGSQHGLVAEVVARDVDTMAQLEVQLVNVLCTKAGVDVGSLCHGWFSVLANGSVFINQSEAIDYETCDLVTLVVRACDLTTDPRFEAYSNNGSLPITIEDVNDNAPYFLHEDKTFGVQGYLAWPPDVVHSCPQARDDDSGDNGAILFSILQVDFITKDGATTTFQGFFRVSTSSADNEFIGNIELVTNLDSTLQGTYQVTVRAQDRPSVGPAQEARITLNLFTVDQSYRVRLQFSTNKEEVLAHLEEIKAALAQATRTTVYVVNIQDMETARAQGRSYLDAYFVFPNGTALTLNELSSMIRSDQDSLTRLLQQGLVVLGSQESQEADTPKVLTGVIVGLGVALLLVIVIMTTVLVCARRSYHRKLLAVKAAKEARKTAVGMMPSDSAIPGTNMYTSEANPMLNLATKDLGFESQSSSSDLDNVSLNSLDDNSVDLEKDKQKIKARWGMSWCLGFLTWGPSLKGWGSGQS